MFETPWFTIEEEWVKTVGQLRNHPYYRINAQSGVIVVAVTEDGRIVLVRQYRPALGLQTLELPSGAVDPNEMPADAAARELYEETGYRCPSLVFLGQGGIMLSRVNAWERAFGGTRAVRDPGFEPKEDIEVVLKTTQELKSLLVAGEMAQLAMLAVLLLADWRLGTRLVTG